jgi:hypothetical protein
MKGNHVMKKALILVLAALAVPSVALAAKPAHPSHPSHPAPMVTYVLQGTLSNYTAYDSVTPANGSITILVKHATKGGKWTKALKGQTLTFPVDANTKIRLGDNVTAIANGDRGTVRIRAAKKIAPAALVATLEASPAKAIVDQGAPKGKH